MEKAQKTQPTSRAKTKVVFVDNEPINRTTPCTDTFAILFLRNVITVIPRRRMDEDEI